MKQLKILFIEDAEHDLVLLTRAIRLAGLVFDFTHVTSMEQLKQTLSNPFDIILSDYNLRGFTAIDVLKFIAAAAVTTPVIVVSGAVSEEDAADLMRLGAKDFVRKDNPARLVPAILRELQEAEQRRARILAETALESSQEFTARILQSTEDGIRVLDHDGRVISDSLGGNNFLFSRSGTASDETIGRAFVEFWARTEDREACDVAIRTAQSGGVGKFVGWRAVEGESAWWNVVVTPIYESRKEPSQLLVVARDVTEDRRRQEDLKAALIQAESANQMKTAFLANMSHEIRTPIGAMMGFAELLIDPNISAEERTGFNEVVRRNGETLLRLLNEILDLSKIEAGHLEIDRIHVPLQTLVDDVITNLQLSATSKGLQLTVHFDDPVGDLRSRMLHTDPVRLKQILTNLLGNAIKFTEVGAVGLTVFSHGPPSSEKIHFLVKDSGPGISEEDQLRLFKTFSQGDNSLSRRFGGTGLGLALSKRLAHALGGDVRIHRSAPGEGSEFLVVIDANHQGPHGSVRQNAPASATGA